MTVAVVPLLALTPSASAAERSFSDTKDDASPQIDATRLVVKNAKANAYVTVKMPKFKRSKTESMIVMLQPQSVKKRLYMALVERSYGGRFSKRLYRESVGESSDGSRARVTPSRVSKIRGDAGGKDIRVRCKKLKVTWRKASVSISVPQQCMGSNRSRLNVRVVTVARFYDADLQGLSEDEKNAYFEKSFEMIPNSPAPHWTRYR